MKKTGTVCIVILLFALLGYAAEQPRTPFVVLRINGVEYNEGAEIRVRPGEKIQVEAVLMGGRRDYCSNPNTYANVGKNTVIESQGENGMSFSINGGQFSGVWSLTEENATFTSGAEVAITPDISNPKMKRSAMVEFKQGNYSKVFFKVTSKTNWHYVRNTQAGRSEQDETNEGTATFYFVLEAGEGVWYSSNNIAASGLEDFSVRNTLDRIQNAYYEIEKSLLQKNMTSAQMQFVNLKTSIGELQKNIDRAKEKNPEYQCSVTLLGLPSDLSMKHIGDLKTVSDKWKENYQICSDNVQQINELLLKTQMDLSSNILRSIFKNYINWGTSIPTGIEDVFTLYDPKNVFTPLDLPRKVMGWYEEAEKDAGILKDQVNSVKNLSELRTFYQNRMDNFVKERQLIVDMITDLKPIEDFNQTMLSYMQGQKTVIWSWKK